MSPVNADGEGSWIAVKNLLEGYKCLSAAKTEIVLIEKKFVRLDEPIKVYNIEVAEAHTYFAGPSSHASALVHNQCGNCNSGRIQVPHYTSVVCSGTGAYGGTYVSYYTTSVCPCVIDKCVDTWDGAYEIILPSSASTKTLKAIQNIANQTVRSSYSWSNSELKQDDRLYIKPGESSGHCVAWINIVMNRIAELPDVINRGNELVFITEEGDAIAVSFEVLDYNGWAPTFTSHAVLRVEIGKAHTEPTGTGVIGDVKFFGEGVKAVIYLDNGAYGGTDRIMNVRKASKSLMPYPGASNKMTLDPELPTPLTQLIPQSTITNWF